MMTPELQTRFDQIMTQVAGYCPKPELELIDKAMHFAFAAHDGQTRKSGEPYIGHPLEVMAITATLRLDPASLCAALLHDTVEDTDVTLEDIQENFGDQVAFLVSGLTKISKLKFRSREEAQAENIRKLIVAMGRDIRVVLVKISDRLHNMRTLTHMSESGQQRIARETIDIYAPLANRLGINWMKIELEDTAFRYLEKEAYYDIREKVAMTRADRETYIHDTSVLLRDLCRDAKLNAEIQGRPKHFYSIYKKLRKNDGIFDRIYDLTAFRIITATKGECYEALGLVHALWRPVAGRFKDYIAIPKPNNYQSLHTTVIGPGGERIEIQIRSRNMHDIAEFGVAAHWAYKEGAAADDGTQFTWLRELMQSNAEIDDSREFLETVRLDLFSDEVFVFTPRGDIKSLPVGSTPIDFAFAVHSEVGLRCTHAKINGRMVPLRHVLKNGDIVEIVTKKDQHPRDEWLDIAKSSRARSKIRHFLHAEKKRVARDLAVEVLSQQLRKRNARYETLRKKGEIKRIAAELRFQNVDQMLVAIGYGKIQPETVVDKLVPREEAAPPATAAGRATKAFGRTLRSLISRPEQRPGITLNGVDGDVMVSYARCCNPVKGEEVIGFVTRGRGLVVHTASCPRIENLEPERQMSVEWDEIKSKDSATTASTRNVALRVISHDTPGILSEMSAAFSSRGVNIQQAHCRATRGGLATSMFDVAVTNVRQLKEAMTQVSKLDGVVSVERV